jgi:hypothetical protein
MNLRRDWVITSFIISKYLFWLILQDQVRISRFHNPIGKTDLKVSIIGLSHIKKIKIIFNWSAILNMKHRAEKHLKLIVISDPNYEILNIFVVEVTHDLDLSNSFDRN